MDLIDIIGTCAVVLFIAALVYCNNREDTRIQREKKEILASIPEEFKYIYLMGRVFIAINLRYKKILLSLDGARKMYDFSDIQGYERGESYHEVISGKVRKITKGYTVYHLILHVNDPENPTWKFVGRVDDREVDCMELLVSRALDGTLPDTDERKVFDIVNATSAI